MAYFKKTIDKKSAEHFLISYCYSDKKETIIYRKLKKMPKYMLNKLKETYNLVKCNKNLIVI